MEAARFRQIYQNEANQGGLRTGGHTYGGCEGGRTPKGKKCHCKTNPKTGEVTGSYKYKAPKPDRKQYSDGTLTWNGYVASIYHDNKKRTPELTLQDVMSDPDVRAGWQDYKDAHQIVTQKEAKTRLPPPPMDGPRQKRELRRANQGQGKLKIR